MPVEIVRLTDASVPVANHISMLAYQSASREEELRRYVKLEPEGWFLALVDGEAAGMGGAINYGAFAYVGLIGVLPEMQHRGIGMAIMRHLLGWLDTIGCPMSLLDASKFGKPLYDQLGYVAEDHTGLWQGEAPDTHAQETWRALGIGAQPLSMANLSELCAYDTPRFGADRAKVLANLLTSYPGRAFATRGDDGRLTGFIIAQKRNLGPWLADAPEDAARLLARALALPFTDTLIAQVPAANHAANTLLQQAGFTQLRALTYMRRGGTQPRLRDGYYGLASFALG
jgi:GNAT superfamily N-acetyltransferase